MKKARFWSIFALIIAMALVLAACGGEQSNSTTDSTEDTGSSTAETTEAAAVGHAHCVCGGDAAGVGDHVCSEVKDWQEWPGIDKVTDGGYYYLTADLEGDALAWYAETKHFSLCLNGHNVTMSERLGLDGSLSICDCAATDGTITSTVNDNQVQGAIVAVLNQSTLNLYGGNLVHADNCTASSGGVYLTKGTVFNMYGGTVSNSTVANNGGNIFVDYEATINLYGGKISNKTDVACAQRGANIYAYGNINVLGKNAVIEGGNANHGGSIYIEADGSFTMSDGTISGGVTAGNGGNLYAKCVVNITGGKIVNGAAAKGGNIFLFKAGVMNISNAEVTGGNATANGGNLYVYEGTSKAYIKTGAVISKGTAATGGNVFCTGTLRVEGGAITEGDVYMDNANAVVAVASGSADSLTAVNGTLSVIKAEAPMALKVMNAAGHAVNLCFADLSADSAVITVTAADPAVAAVATLDVAALPGKVQATGMKVEADGTQHKLMLG